MMQNLSDRIFEIDETGFGELALDVFHFQYSHCPLYRSYVDELPLDPHDIGSVHQVPFLPIEFFKTREVRTTAFEPQAVFESSGTTGAVNSKHYVKSLDLYERSFVEGFERFYGQLKDWCVIGLLPSYLERNQSSLVRMVDGLIHRSGNDQSGFYLYEHEKLNATLHELEGRGQQTLLIGVTFALLDFAEKFPQRLRCTVVMETGGMKGRREELTRQEVHGYLEDRLGVPVIHAEYGMTELLSQAYSRGLGVFTGVPWMKVLVRQEDDPFGVLSEGTGILNVIDLANLYSCSFIATDDVGSVLSNGRFEVAGRLDHSDLRGCSLLVR